MALPHRYSKLPLPPYRYVPGRAPHPTRDPGGHSFGKPQRAEPLGVQTWPSCETYLFGIDCFNRGYWWEAHEALEGLWRGAGRNSEVGRLLQGVIQVAAALVKDAMGARPAGRRLAARGCDKVRRVPDGLLGIDGRLLARDVQAYLEGGRKAPPVIRLRGTGFRP